MKNNVTECGNCGTQHDGGEACPMCNIGADLAKPKRKGTEQPWAWSNIRPSISGWYWFRAIRRGVTVEDKCVYVEMHPTLGGLIRDGRLPSEVDEWEGLWCGPIPMPNEIKSSGIGTMGSGVLHYCPKCRCGVWSCEHDSINELDRLRQEKAELLEACKELLGYVELSTVYRSAMTVNQILTELERIKSTSEVSMAHHIGCQKTTRRVDLNKARAAIAKASK